MPKCDICSKPLDGAEMKVVAASKVSAVTARGFVPRNLLAHSPMKALGSLLSPSDVDRWKSTVSQNRTADWGLCSDCAVELESY
jgi:hypothetical protein